MPLMKPALDVGIIGYGAYVPCYRLPASEVSRIWHPGGEREPVQQKAVAGPDEDTVTMSIEAARNALARANIDPTRLGAVWVGSESHPYAVKPTSAIVAEAIGATPHVLAGDWQFACKAGTEALQAALALVGSGMVPYALAIGMDTAQSRPGDALEYTAAAGGAAYIVGAASEAIALLQGSVSFVTENPDFWRRPQRNYPEHGGRFTGEPSYFRHTVAAATELMEALGRTAQDYAYAVFHQPNGRFPRQAAARLGFRCEQIEAGLLVDQIGNAYAGSSMLGLGAVLDIALPGDRILHVSYGSGAGSDAFEWLVTEGVQERRHRAPLTSYYVNRTQEIDYATYARFRNKLQME
jgi:hydroxymethylglutaryl-CoA synthase